MTEHLPEDTLVPDPEKRETLRKLVRIFTGPAARLTGEAAVVVGTAATGAVVAARARGEAMANREGEAQLNPEVAKLKLWQEVLPFLNNFKMLSLSMIDRTSSSNMMSSYQLIPQPETALDQEKLFKLNGPLYDRGLRIDKPMVDTKDNLFHLLGQSVQALQQQGATFWQVSYALKEDALEGFIEAQAELRSQYQIFINMALGELKQAMSEALIHERQYPTAGFTTEEVEVMFQELHQWNEFSGSGINANLTVKDHDNSLVSDEPGYDWSPASWYRQMQRFPLVSVHLAVQQNKPHLSMRMSRNGGQDTPVNASPELLQAWQTFATTFNALVQQALRGQVRLDQVSL
jgi:hypothetical protein